MTPARLDSDRVFWITFACLHLWKLVLAGSLDVSLDGGYYHYWALFPQWSYFDHPPLVAWAMALLRPIGDDTVWMVRFWPLVGSVVLVLTGRALGGRMFGPAAGNRAGLLLLWAPLLAGNGLVMTPDALFAPLYALAVAAAWTALQADTPRDRRRRWVLTGCWAGLGLLAKYNMVLLWGGLGLFWLYPSGRRRQVFRGATIAAATAAFWFLPVLYWNARHDWISFRFQLGHGLADHGANPWLTLPLYLAGLLLVASPILSALALWRGTAAVVSPRNEDRFLAAMAWAVLLLFGWSALKTEVEPNWPMLAFFPLLVLLAGQWTAVPPVWRTLGLALVVLTDLTLLTYLSFPRSIPLDVAGVSLEVGRMREFTGGRELARAVQQELELRHPDFLVTDRHQMLGRISFYLPAVRDRLILLADRTHRTPWIDPQPWRGKDALWISQRSRLDHLPHREQFERIVPLGAREIRLRGHLTQTVHFYYAVGFQPPAGTRRAVTFQGVESASKSWYLFPRPGKGGACERMPGDHGKRCAASEKKPSDITRCRRAPIGWNPDGARVCVIPSNAAIHRTYRTGQPRLTSTGGS